MNNKTIIEFGFRIIWRIMEISEGVIRLITPSSISTILHKILSLIHYLLYNININNNDSDYDNSERRGGAKHPSESDL